MKNNFKIIRKTGTPNFVEFKNGVRIYRPSDDRVFVKQWGRYVKRIDYDNHFVALFEAFEKHKGTSFAYCSCGSPAVVVGYNAYIHGASPSSGEGLVPGEMLVCYAHVTYGKHEDGSS